MSYYYDHFRSRTWHVDRFEFCGPKVPKQQEEEEEEEERVRPRQKLVIGCLLDRREKRQRDADADAETETEEPGGRVSWTVNGREVGVCVL